ncbi:sugar ABC transporter substrate-binding protein [Kribbella yunnanensis]|uniref:Sugar ABC transporter substrate-binding protein n=1 Tax=Kribbella yunnanensis TaxID=190194 RepID=A0ABN2IVM0_9ACTN
MKNPLRSTNLSRRTLLRGTGAAVVAGGLAACAPGNTTGGSPLSSVNVSTPPAGEITIWDRTGDLYKVFGKAIASFTAKYPQVKVNHLAVDIGAKLPATLISGAGVPDGAFYDDALLAGVAPHLHDLSQLIAPYKSDIAPYKLGVVTVDGKVIAVPWDLDPGLLFYREDIVAQAGVDPAGLTTYDALLDAARAVREKSPKARPIHLENDQFLAQLWIDMFANQQGGAMVDADGKLTIDSDPYRTTLTWLDKVRSEGLGTLAKYTQPTDLQTQDNGTQVFVPWAQWFAFAPQQLLKASKGKWRATTLPAWQTGGARAGVMGGSSFVIPAKAKNPELAWRLYEHLVFSKEGYTTVYGPNEIYPGGLNTSIPSYLKALDPNVPLFKPIDALGGQDLWKIAVEAGKQVPGGYTVPTWWGKAVDYFGVNVQKLLAGQMTPDEVLKTSASQIQKNLMGPS